MAISFGALVLRSCQEISSRDLGQRSYIESTKLVRRDLAQTSCTQISHKHLAKRPLWQRETETERERETDRQTERERETESERERERDRERERETEHVQISSALAKRPLLRSCIETLHRDLLQRSCREVSYRDLNQRSLIL